MEDTRLGAILLESGLVDEADLERALSIQALTGSVRPIGQVLVEQGLVDSATLQRILELQRTRSAVRAAAVGSADALSSSLLRAAHANGACEIVVSEGRSVRIRVGSEWRELTGEVVTGPEVWDFAREVVGRDVLEELAEHGCVVRGWRHGEYGHGSARVFRHFDGVAVRLTFVMTDVSAATAPGIPEQIVQLARSGRGLILIAGERGAGRAEALAFLAQQSAGDPASHVIVIDEEPLALPSAPGLFVHRRFGTTPEQRAASLKSAVREDPDVLVIEDLGEPETFEMALRAAEGGRLVIGYIDSPSVIAALNRVLDFYPVHDITRVRASLAAVLRALVVRHQMLHSNGAETVVATELLLVDDAVRSAMRSGELGNISLLLRVEGGRCGHSLDANMLELLAQGSVRMEDVFARAEEKAWLLERTRDSQTATR